MRMAYRGGGVRDVPGVPAHGTRCRPSSSFGSGHNDAMTDGPVVRRVGILAPMQIELDPIVRRLALEPDGDVYGGRVGGVEVVVMLAGVGMAAGARAARRMLERGVDWVMVVGVAGGVDAAASRIGDVVRPETVTHRERGLSFRPHDVDGAPRAGTLSCGDDLVTDRDTLSAMAAEGVVALDMETAAVAEVCEAAGCPWSVFRTISDFAGEGLVDEAVFAMARPDGSVDVDAVQRYLRGNPEGLDTLARLAGDAGVAVEAAASAAAAACARLSP